MKRLDASGREEQMEVLFKAPTISFPHISERIIGPQRIKQQQAPSVSKHQTATATTTMNSNNQPVTVSEGKSSKILN